MQHTESQLPDDELSPESRATIRCSRQIYWSSMLQKRGKPYGGAYYWVPLPSGEWNVLDFGNRFYGRPATHDKVWPEAVSILARLWQVREDELQQNFKGSLNALPRGLVRRQRDGQIVVVHGGDIPEALLISSVLERFNLSADTASILVAEKVRSDPTLQAELTGFLKAAREKYRDRREPE